MQLTAEDLNKVVMKFRRKYRRQPTTIYADGNLLSALHRMLANDYKVNDEVVSEYQGMLVKPAESNKLVIEEPEYKDGRAVGIKKIVEVHIDV